MYCVIQWLYILAQNVSPDCEKCIHIYIISNNLKSLESDINLPGGTSVVVDAYNCSLASFEIHSWNFY